ncbi:ABC transporter ATP-binding protein [[Clostridium] colinum]|uniref:ABC transporter ATP-binding protein n=1 Tax=[Clostridium] colinum TaxID=36835 RepID=UPI0020245219|nr:ABC transporter ATP-binding protein [[Clostridium] colinum]
MDTLIKINNLCKYYGNKNSRVDILNNINLEIYNGEFLVIMGKSGSGKSTLLNIIATIDKGNSGEVIMNGENLEKFSPSKSNDFRRENLGFIFQDFKLLDTMNVKENVAVPLLLKKENINTINKKIDEILERLEISYLKDKRIFEISGGEKQRVACARAIIGNPKLIIADEPTGALDSKSSEIVMNLLKKINKEFNTTLIMVTHDKNIANYGDRVIEIKDGSIKG